MNYANCDNNLLFPGYVKRRNARSKGSKVSEGSKAIGTACVEDYIGDTIYDLFCAHGIS